MVVLGYFEMCVIWVFVWLLLLFFLNIVYLFLVLNVFGWDLNEVCGCLCVFEMFIFGEMLESNFLILLVVSMSLL